MSTAIATALASSFAWILRRLVLGLLVASSLSGMADMPQGSPQRDLPVADRAAAAAAEAQRAGTARDDQVMRVAAAASAPMGLHGPGLAGNDIRSLPSDPPAFLLFIAGLLAIVFITTRRRKDR